MSKFTKTEAKRVLLFNSCKRLVAIFQSALAAAKVLDVHTQSVHYACTGICISAKRYYLRHLSDDIEVTIDDLGKLRLEEYDKLCGVERVYYPTNKMQRKGMKYTKRKNMINGYENKSYKPIKTSASGL